MESSRSDADNAILEYSLTSLQNDLDYIDDNAEKLGRQKMRSDAMKRQFAINGWYSVFRFDLYWNHANIANRLPEDPKSDGFM